MLCVYLDRHLVMLYQQILPCIEVINTVHGMSTSNIQHSVIGVCSKYAVEVWYRLDKLHTLDLEPSRHPSGAHDAWHTARMLAGGVWVHWLGN